MKNDKIITARFIKVLCVLLIFIIIMLVFSWLFIIDIPEHYTKEYDSLEDFTTKIEKEVTQDDPYYYFDLNEIAEFNDCSAFFYRHGGGFQRKSVQLKRYTLEYIINSWDPNCYLKISGYQGQSIKTNEEKRENCGTYIYQDIEILLYKSDYNFCALFEIQNILYEVELNTPKQISTEDLKTVVNSVLENKYEFIWR